MIILFMVAIVAAFATCSPTKLEAQDWGKKTDAWTTPDISHCWELAEERELWDCVREAEE